MMTREQFHVFMLRVAEGYNFATIARMLHKRKADVLRIWEEARLAFRDAFPDAV
jgi:DNA-directed RNA polymerase specialized sigma24 family protein